MRRLRRVGTGGPRCDDPGDHPDQEVPEAGDAAADQGEVPQLWRIGLGLRGDQRPGRWSNRRRCRGTRPARHRERLPGAAIFSAANRLGSAAISCTLRSRVILVAAVGLDQIQAGPGRCAQAEQAPDHRCEEDTQRGEHHRCTVRRPAAGHDHADRAYRDERYAVGDDGDLIDDLGEERAAAAPAPTARWRPGCPTGSPALRRRWWWTRCSTSTAIAADPERARKLLRDWGLHCCPDTASARLSTTPR